MGFIPANEPLLQRVGSVLTLSTIWGGARVPGSDLGLWCLVLLTWPLWVRQASTGWSLEHRGGWAGAEGCPCPGAAAAAGKRALLSPAAQEGGGHLSPWPDAQALLLPPLLTLHRCRLPQGKMHTFTRVLELPPMTVWFLQ